VSITDYIRQRRARNAYWDAGMDANHIVDQLWFVDDPAERADLLYALGNRETALADLHPIAWGAEPNPDEGGRDMAESLGSSSILIRAVAATERPRGAIEVWLDTASAAESAMWRKLTTVRDRRERANLLDQIHDHAADRYGGQAAEVLVTIANTERELASAAAEGREPAAPADPMLSLRRTIATVLCVAAAIVVLSLAIGH
jgi:hypothetical protein